MDDIAKLCSTSTVTTFVILGRTQILDDCWLYLSDKGISTALITIAPFDIAGAKEYIDAFTDGATSPYAAQYSEARDFIISQLSRAFVAHVGDSKEEFLSFIGYPPVLDSIVTLLTEEKNYHGLLQELRTDDAKDIEVSLLKRIAEYILDRERVQKVVPNIVGPLVEGAPEGIRIPALARSFLPEEQSARLVAHCLGRSLTLPAITEPVLNEKYEAQLVTFLTEHPFIKGQDFRNTVFEALALATLITSRNPLFHEIVTNYVASHKHSYHLIYMLDAISEEHCIPISNVNAVLLSAMEFRSVRALVEMQVNGPDPEENLVADDRRDKVEIDIEIKLGGELEPAKSFTFYAEILPESCLELGPRLGGAFVTVPCVVGLGGALEVEITAPVEISSRSLRIDSRSLTVRPSSAKAPGDGVIIDTGRLTSLVESITTNGVPFHVGIGDMAGVSYPIIQYAHESSNPPTDPLLRQKYFRLRRILLEFRSHSRGSLARYKIKIENERVLRNDVGRAVLQKLVDDKVLLLKGDFYHLDPAAA